MRKIKIIRDDPTTVKRMEIKTIDQKVFHHLCKKVGCFAHQCHQLSTFSQNVKGNDHTIYHIVHDNASSFVGVSSRVTHHMTNDVGNFSIHEV